MLSFLGFHVSQVGTEKLMEAAVSELGDEILMVSEARRGRAKKIRKTEGITRILMRKCIQEKWMVQLHKLEHMLQTLEATKADVSDVVNGWQW